MKVLMKTGAVAAMLVVSGAASASTIHNVTAPEMENNIGNGGMYRTVLTAGQTASVDVVTETDGITSSVLGFQYQPSNLTQRFALTLNDIESDLYGTMNAYLSDDATLSDDDVSATSQTLDLGNGTTIQSLFANTKFNGGEFFVLLDWETEADNSFSYDVSVAAVPVPAAGFLLLGAVGGMAALRRRKKAA